MAAFDPLRIYVRQAIPEGMAEGSTRVVYAALVGNALVAVSKFAAAAISGSSAMLTEAIHSTADCTNQLLLLIGVRRGKLPPDPSHPFGYGMEIYFWTFVVAVLVLLAGGAVSIFQGFREVRSPHLIESPVVNFVVLALSGLFEGYSFSVGYREYRSLVARHTLPGLQPNLFRFIAWSKDPSLYESLLEDGTALAGIVVATVGIAASFFSVIFVPTGLHRSPSAFSSLPTALPFWLPRVVSLLVKPPRQRFSTISRGPLRDNNGPDASRRSTRFTLDRIAC